MATYSTSEFKSGLKIMIDNDPCAIVENEFVKPGKGQAFSRVKIRNLKTGRVVERTFRSGETVEAADVVDTDMQYLYNDGEYWHFMVADTFEQYAATNEAVGTKSPRRRRTRCAKASCTRATSAMSTRTAFFFSSTARRTRVPQLALRAKLPQVV